MTSLLLACLILLLPAANEPLVQSFDFSHDAGLATVASGEGAERDGVGPKIENGELMVLEPWWRLKTSVGLDAPSDEGARRLQMSFELALSRGSEGVGVAWLDTERHGKRGPAPPVRAWEGPNILGSLSLGFDASNPWTSEPFRGSGNIHHRPEHEISLHWDGRERFKKRTQTDFRDEEPRRVKWEVQWVPGGARVDLTLGDEVVFDGYFLAGVTPYAGRAAFGGHNAETAGWATVDDLELRLEDRYAPEEGGFPDPVEVIAIERALNNRDHPSTDGLASFPEASADFARVLMTLRLDEPVDGFDPWDRLAHVYVEDERLGLVELLRYITPFDRGYQWTVDVSDFRSLLQGERRIEQFCETYAEGWRVSVGFHFYPRPEHSPKEPEPFRIERLWEGPCVIGDPDQPPSDFFVPRTIAVPQGASSAEVRTVVTGHGLSPNSENAAEFMPLERTLTINGTPHANELWKTDNYLNPCRPQGGTWKYDRAGWAPGDVVVPWEVPCPVAAPALQFGYALAPYINENRGGAWDPFHQVTSYVVFYRDLVPPPEAEDDAIPAESQAPDPSAPALP